MSEQGLGAGGGEWILRGKGQRRGEEAGTFVRFVAEGFLLTSFFLPDEPGAQTYDRGEAQKEVAKDCTGCHSPFTSRAAEWLVNDPGLLEPYQLQPNPCLPSKTHPVSSG